MTRALRGAKQKTEQKQKTEKEKMESIINLFKGDTTRIAAIGLAALSFAAGALLSCIVCKLAGKCKRCSGAKPKPEGDAGRSRFQKRRPPAPEGTIEIYVGNLSYELTEDVLRKEFEAFGTVASARIITNRYNGKSKGFGFVHMPNRAEADAAVKALNDKLILGRNLKCNQARNA